jgi:dipeptidyl aminopeptidase/acylaminoacyl peptidase
MEINILILAAFAILSGVELDAEAGKRFITVEDCVATRRIVMEETKLSPKADLVAYVVKAPDIKRNLNVFELYVRQLNDTEKRMNGRLLYSGASVREIKWLPNGRELLFLTEGKGGKSRVIRLDVKTGKSSIVVEYPGIEDYSTDATGQKVVFSVVAKSDQDRVSERDEKRGYSVEFGKAKDTSLVRDPHTTRLNLFVAKTVGSSAQTIAELNLEDGVLFKSPILNLRNLNMSPDGKFLLFHCRPDHPPANWEENVITRGFVTLGMSPPVLGLYEMETGRVRLAINAPDPDYRTLWSADGKAFAVNSVFPIGSVFEKESPSLEPSFKTDATKTHLLTVNATTGTVSLAIRNPESEDELPMWWTKGEGPMIVRIDKRTIVELGKEGERWGEIRRFVGNGLQSGIQNSGTSNGKIEIESAEQPMIPPDLRLTEIASGKAVVLTDLNPDYRNIVLGSVERIEWKNKFGARCTGYLIKPVGYQEGRRYPLVIMAKGWDDSFLADTTYRTAFPPQVLAGSGFLVLLANNPSPDKEPRDYPGQMGEAFNWMEMVSSAISLVSNQGLIDENKVGIMGFSRTSWLVDFMLTHSKFKFAAASSADSGVYNYGSYWLSNNGLIMKGSAAQYGGPPYGESFRNWLAYAPAFNAENVETPLLMEYTESWIGDEPLSAHEFFVALRSEGKPADLYYYPRGEHELDTPAERVASLQRNVDWFRFWMQGYERPDPEVAEQYRRWRSLKGDRAAGRPPTGKD